MEKAQKVKKENAEKKIGEFGYINRTCWLANTVNYSPSNRCQYCESKFRDCLFFQYMIISLILVAIITAISLYIDKTISKPLIISIFILVITYGYFFDKSTEKIVKANFAQRKAKEALEDLTKNLQQKIDDQVRDIKKAYEIEKKAKEDLEVLDKTKNQFLLTIQHHLRTPLSSMMGYLDLILAESFGKVSIKVKEVLKRLKDSTSSEIKIVNDLLDISEFQLGKNIVRLEQGVDVEAILIEIMDNLIIEAQKKDIYLKFKKAENIPVIPADRNRLLMALTNIVDNSVKYTKKGGVSIDLKTKDNKILITIEDTGIGMPEDCLQKLFNQTFQRCEEAQKLFALGRGIGLFLSAKIIYAHNGKIWAKSEGEGKGSTFYIELPTSSETVNKTKV
jgi:signal transduction histidine kinase